jgi:hypothetical protein
MITLFGERIEQIREEMPQNRQLYIPRDIPINNLFITRIGDIAFYLDTKIDNIAIYDIANKKMIDKEELPPIMDDFDFNMLIILFKDKNDSLLKLITSTENEKFVIDAMNVNKLIVPKLEKMVRIAPTPDNKIDRFTMQSLIYEPEFNEYGDIRRGESD